MDSDFNMGKGPKPQSKGGSYGAVLPSIAVQTTSAEHLIKILLLGDTGVGKSSLMLRYTEGEFKQALVGTAGVDYKLKNIELGGKSLKI
jgi:GTPase SAR1 family protein